VRFYTNKRAIKITVFWVFFFFAGVINHGREVLAFVDVHQWGHDSNFTINVLLRTLSRMEYIPDVLYTQMDNCWRENKNQFIIIFLAVLIKYKVFKKVMK